MCNEVGYGRLLIHVPLEHGAEMGTLRDRLPYAPPGLLPGDGAMLAAVGDWARGFVVKWSTAKVYQEGLPHGDEDAVRRALERGECPNSELLLWLQSQRAKVMGTESPAFLERERWHLAAVVHAADDAARETALEEYAREAGALLKARDQYMARRIDATLAPEEEVGVLFIGKAHRAEKYLAPDILTFRVRVGRGPGGGTP